jgi:hypothetical protein
MWGVVLVYVWPIQYGALCWCMAHTVWGLGDVLIVRFSDVGVPVDQAISDEGQHLGQQPDMRKGG